MFGICSTNLDLIPRATDDLTCVVALTCSSARNLKKGKEGKEKRKKGKKKGKEKGEVLKRSFVAAPQRLALEVTEL